MYICLLLFCGGACYAAMSICAIHVKPVRNIINSIWSRAQCFHILWLCILYIRMLHVLYITKFIYS